MADRADLDETARIHQLAKSGCVERRSDAVSLARLVHDKARGCQPGQRLAHRRLRDAERLGEHADMQRGAAAQRAARQHLQDRAVDPFAQHPGRRQQWHVADEFALAEHALGFRQRARCSEARTAHGAPIAAGAGARR